MKHTDYYEVDKRSQKADSNDRRKHIKICSR